MAVFWGRLFYLYGDGQKENSLIPSLQKALKEKQPFFYMSKGDQLRDFIHIKEAIKMLKSFAISKKKGVLNISTGIPQSVLSFVKQYLKKNNAKIELKCGAFDTPIYEPKSFWGLNNW